MTKSITALVFGLAAAVSAQALAQVPTTPLQLKPDAPARYTVVRGDTLWGISERYTDSPWRWPELWDMNKEQIRNPHLIYPGNTIVLDRVRGRLALEGEDSIKFRSSADAATATGSASASAVSGPLTAADMARLSPRARLELLEKAAIPSIPAEIIEPFLSRPLVIEPDGLDGAPTIIATEDDRVLLAPGHSAYVRGIGTSAEESWYVYRRGNALVDPDTGRALGYEALYLGTARVTRPGDIAIVQLTAVTQEIENGDKLIPAETTGTVNYAPRAPSTVIEGRVMSIFQGVGRVGETGPPHAIVTINRGRANGLEVGHVLALHLPGRTVVDRTGFFNRSHKLPDERYGIVFVFRVFERVSYALVMRVTRPVAPLDVVRTP